MKKIKLSHDLTIPGYGVIKEGTEFKVVKFNSRFVYVKPNPGTELRLSRKTDCKVVY